MAASQTLRGLGVAPGIAVGRAVCFQDRLLEVFRIPLADAAVEQEVTRLHQAVARAQDELRATREKAALELGDDLVAIFDAQSLLLSDAVLLGRVADFVRAEKVNAEWAVHQVADEFARRFDSLDHPDFRDRKDDLRDVTRFLLSALQGVAHHDLAELESDVIIVAHDLTPSEAIRLGRQRVVAFATETGGPTSHTSLIARDLGLPMVSGLHGLIGLVTEDDPVVVDGSAGEVILHPTDEQLAATARRRLARAEEQRRRESARDLPCVTRDGVAVELAANVDLPEEIEAAQRAGAVGVGLYRSEFLYIERSPELPSEEEHLAIYRQMLDAFDPHPVVVRTFDLGGRKLAREMMGAEGDNPALGLRGIRLTLARPDVFRPQLRALLRAARGRDLRVMLPLIASVEEVRAFRALLGEVAAEMRGVDHLPPDELRIGAMIEVPAAAMTADLLARELDFFSIGTNDLIQYTLAVDRNNEQVSYLYEPLHPGLLRMIRSIVASAHAAGIGVSVCGEMAADPRMTPLLVGLGLRRLSVNPRLLAEIKQRIRGLSAAEAATLAERCLAAPTGLEAAGEVDAFDEWPAPVL